MIDALTKESQSEYAWQAEKEEHFLQITHIKKDGSKHTDSIKYAPDGYYSHFDEGVYHDDAKLEIVPYQQQSFVNETAIKLDGGKTTIDQLVVGVKDDTTIVFVGFLFTRDGHKGVNQFFFKDDGHPAGSNFGMIKATSWPLNREPLADELKPYLMALAEMHLGATESLKSAVTLLSAPGPNYHSVS